MDVVMMTICSTYGWEGEPNGQMWEELLLAPEIATDSGFDCPWSAEHRCNDYLFVPDKIMRGLEGRRILIGNLECNVLFRFA